MTGCNGARKTPGAPCHVGVVGVGRGDPGLGERLHCAVVLHPADGFAAENGVPLGVLAGARLVRDVPVDAMLTYDDVQLDESLAIVAMRRIQDDMLADAATPSLDELRLSMTG